MSDPVDLKIRTTANYIRPCNIFDYTDFSSSDLTGVCFDNQTLIGTIFNSTYLKGTK